MPTKPDSDTIARKAIRKLLPKIPDTVDEMRSVVADAAQTSYTIDKLEASKASEIAIVNKTYGGEIAALRKRLGTLASALQAWATKHRGQFGDKQRLIVDGHALRWQRSPGALAHDGKPAEQVEAILATGDEELIEAALALKPAPDKTTIKALLEQGGEMAEQLAAIGYRIDKPETFQFDAAAPQTDTAVLEE